MSLARAISLIDDRVYTGPAQALSDPTDLLHRWAASAPERNSPLLAATLRRSSDGVEADFACDARGYLPRAEVLAWAGVTVEPDGTMRGPEIITNGNFSAGATGWAVNAEALLSVADGIATVTFSEISNTGIRSNTFSVVAGKTYRIAYSARKLAYTGTLMSIRFPTASSAAISNTITSEWQSFVNVVVLAETRSDALLQIQRGSSVSGSVEIDNVSVREVISSTSSAVTVPRLWGSAGTQLGPELFDPALSLSRSGGIAADAIDFSVAGRVTATATSVGYAGKSFTTVVGKLYRVVTNVRSGSTNAGYYGVRKGDLFGSTNLVDFRANSTGPVDGTFTATATTSWVFVQVNGIGHITLDYPISVREVLTANAVQTTTASQPPLDLTANPLRIGASASKSLVATLPAAITGARVLTADENGVAVATANLASGAYTVQLANALRERVVLAADTPEADVDAVKRNMMRAWRLGAAA